VFLSKQTESDFCQSVTAAANRMLASCISAY